MIGKGRGGKGPFSSSPLQMWDSRPGKPPGKSWIKPDPVTGCYKLYVKSIPRTWTEITLKNVFLKVGLPTSVFLNHQTDYHLNWGFVEYASFEEASSAVKNFNNNLALDYIQVTFAREKSEASSFYHQDDNDSFFDDPVHMQSFDLSAIPKPAIDAKAMSRTIINDQPLRADIPIDPYNIDFLNTSNDDSWMDAVFEKRSRSAASFSTSKTCQFCRAKSFLKCINCDIMYCSEDCQKKDWGVHSTTCKSLSGGSHGNRADVRGGGDNRQSRDELSNGYKFDEPGKDPRSNNRPQDPRYNDTRSYGKPRNDDRSNNRYGDRENSNLGDRQSDGRSSFRDRSKNRNNDRQNDGGSSFRDRSKNRNNDRQNDSNASRNMFEERKSRFNSVKQNQNDNRSTDRSRERNKQFSSNNKPGQNLPPKFEDWGSAAKVSATRQAEKPASAQKDNIVSATREVDKPEPALAQKDSTKCAPDVKPQITSLQPGVLEQALILTPGESLGMFYVLLNRLQNEFATLSGELGEPSTPFTPVENGICAAQFDYAWSRCQITSLNPLTVKYIDFGNTEVLKADRLFSISTEVASRPPFAIKIKLADGTPDEFLNKTSEDELSMKARKQVDDYWLVEVDGVQYPKEQEQPAVPKPVPTALPTPKVEEKVPQPAAVTATTYVLKSGEEETVLVLSSDEPSFYHVLPKKKSEEFASLMNFFVSEVPNTPFTPVENGMCVAEFDGTWCRCQIICLSPLTVLYIDFGNTEVLNADRLFSISSAELASRPSYAIKIKLADGTPAEFLSKTYGEELSIKPTHQVEDYWVAQVMGVEYPSTEVPTVQVKEVVQKERPVFPKLLPGDVFTEVRVKYRYQPPSQNIAVTPTRCSDELDSFMATVQILAYDAAAVKLQPNAKCIAKKVNKWYRGRVIALEPLQVYFVDYGNTEMCSPNNLKELPADLISTPPFVVTVRPKEGTSKELMLRDILRVKPLHKDNTENSWVVEIGGIPTEPTKVSADNGKYVSDTKVTQPTTEPMSSGPATSNHSVKSNHSATSNHSASSNHSATSNKSATSNHSVTSNKPATSIQSALYGNMKLPVIQPTYPDLFKVDQYTTVSITHPEPAESGAVDTYYVGQADVIWTTLNEMNTEFSRVISQCDLLKPEHGAVGLSQYENFWYRVKVVNVSPLTVHFIDFGNIDVIEAGNLRRCPNTHLDMKRQVQRIKLAPGTSSKYFNLPPESGLSVKPIAMLPDATTLVQIEGETYDSAPNNVAVSLPPTEPNTSKQPSSHSPHTPEVTVKTVAENVETILTKKERPDSSVDLLEAHWPAVFLPDHINLASGILIGSCVSSYVEDTDEFLSSDAFDTSLEGQKYDKDYKPSEGELVACQSQNSWNRAEVIAPDLLATVDTGTIIRCSQYQRLPEEFYKVPLLAAVFRLSKENIELLKNLNDMSGFKMQVEEVHNDDDKNVVMVHVEVDGAIVEGELSAWGCDPLANPEVLTSGDLVTLSHVINSNMVVVSPVDAVKTYQIIQIECNKTSGMEFKAPPEVGDYVAFFKEDVDMFYRSRIDQINADKDEYVLYNIDNGRRSVTRLTYLRPLPDTLAKIPCCATQVELKDVEKQSMTSEIEAYFMEIVEEGNVLKIIYDANSALVTLAVNDSEGVVNKTVQELLQQAVLPDQNGKFMFTCLPEARPPMNQEIQLMVSHTDPLYMHLWDSGDRVNRLLATIQNHCTADNTSYNPCENELCLVSFDGEWYRATCLRETNSGISSVMLVDFGNIFNAPTCTIRRMHPSLLTEPCLALACKVKGVKSDLTPELRATMNKLFEVYSIHTGIIESDTDGYFTIDIPSLPDVLRS